VAVEKIARNSKALPDSNEKVVGKPSINIAIGKRTRAALIRVAVAKEIGGIGGAIRVRIEPPA